MAGILGYTLPSNLSKTTNANLSAELDNLEEGAYDYVITVEPNLQTSKFNFVRIATSNNQGKLGGQLNSFFADFYNRIHVTPTRLELGTIAISQSKSIKVWNAFTNFSPVLNTAVITGADGITIEGTIPFTFNPLQEVDYSILVNSRGAPSIEGILTFDFSAFDPLPILITGTRAIVFQTLPEVPITEKWEWLTNIFTSVDGTEQRVCLRNAPRRSSDLSYKGLSIDEVRLQHRTLLQAGGKLFIPYMQWATQTTQPSAIGTDLLYFKTGYCDLRVDDYALILDKGNSVLVQILAITATYAQVKSLFDVTINQNAIVIPCFSSVIDNNQALKRNLIDTNADMTLSTDCLDIRTQFTRPGSLATLTTVEGLAVLTRRPTPNGGQTFTYDTGQERIDNKTGNIDAFSLWSSTKEVVSLEFLVHRYVSTACNLGSIEEMDYWRLFFDTVKGSFKSFLLPSFRSDQDLAEVVPQGADSLVMEGDSYAEAFFKSAGYNYIALTSSLGVHYARVVSAAKNGDGNSTITFTPPLPNVAGWEVITMISYLRRVRMASDSVKLEHTGLDTVFEFNVRTTEA